MYVISFNIEILYVEVIKLSFLLHIEVLIELSFLLYI